MSWQPSLPLVARLPDRSGIGLRPRRPWSPPGQAHDLAALGRADPTANDPRTAPPSPGKQKGRTQTPESAAPGPRRTALLRRILRGSPLGSAPPPSSFCRAYPPCQPLSRPALTSHQSHTLGALASHLRLPQLLAGPWPTAYRDYLPAQHTTGPPLVNPRLTCSPHHPFTPARHAPARAWPPGLDATLALTPAASHPRGLAHKVDAR